MASKEYDSLRGKVIKKGKSLRQWAIDSGYPPSTVYGAAKRERSGVEATKILTALEAFVCAK